MFAGGFDLTSVCAVLDGADDVDVLRHLDSLVRKSLVVADHTATRTRYSLFETIRQFADDRLAETGARERTRDRHAAYFAAGGGRAMGALERSRLARRSRLGRGRAGQPSGRIPVERGTRRPGGGDRHRGPRRAHGLLGAAVRDAGVGRGAARRATAADVRRLPRLCTAAGYACFAGRAPAARENAHRATELELDDRYDACEPGYAPFVEALCNVYCGDLDRYIELTRGVAERYGSDRGYGLASYVDGLQSAGRIDEALALAEESVAAARSLGNPYWISYALWIAGMAFSKADVRRAFAAWDEGVAFVREQRVEFFEGFLARDAARLHTSDGEPEAALVLFADAIAAFHTGRQRSAVDHHVGERARVVRAARPAGAGRDAPRRARHGSRRACTTSPSSASSAIASSRALGQDACAAELMAEGAALDLGDAAGLRAAADRRRAPRPGPAGTRGAARAA